MRLIGWVVPIALCASGALAYEVKTHRRLSEAAWSASQLENDAERLADYGLQVSLTYPSPTTTPQRIPILLAEGSDREDDSIRFRNHFYDPSTGQPLGPPWCSGCTTSPDWALEDTDEYGNQDASYRDVRTALLSSLTATDPAARAVAVGETFQRLGHVIHHLQDMAQPQHTRNEAHFWGKAPAYEAHTDEHYGVRALESHSAATLVQVVRARDLWQSAGRGIAEYSNTNFVTVGTNLRWPYAFFEDPEGARRINAATEPAYPLPSGTGAYVLSQSYQQIRDAESCLPSEGLSEPPYDATVHFVGTVIDDPVEGSSSINFRSTALSAFDQDLKDVGGCSAGDEDCAEGHFTQNRFTFCAARAALLPKAIAYSASMIVSVRRTAC